MYVVRCQLGSICDFGACDVMEMRCQVYTTKTQTDQCLKQVARALLTSCKQAVVVCQAELSKMELPAHAFRINH